jgi:hypothetical protein
MIYNAKAKMFIPSLDARYLPWALCAMLAAAMMVTSKPQGTGTEAKITRLEKRLRALEGQPEPSHPTNYSIIPSPAEELPALDSPQFLAKCRQWNVNPDRVASLARRLAEEQSISIEPEKPRVTESRIVKRSRRSRSSSFVVFRGPEKPSELAQSLTQSFDLESLASRASTRWSSSTVAMSSARPKPSTHRRRRHRASA